MSLCFVVLLEIEIDRIEVVCLPCFYGFFLLGLVFI
jgi:hypothetical protein